MMNEHLNQHEIAGFDALADERRDAALDHLRECGVCRTAWLADDESRVFSLLARAPLAEEKLAQLSDRLDAAIDELQPRGPVRRGVFRVASIAASLLLAAVLGVVMWNHELPARIATVEDIAPLPFDEEIAGIRLVTTPGGEAQVLDLSIGGTQILMIFDESIEL
jgi:hypothetical protein